MAEGAFNEDSNSPVVTEVSCKITEDLNKSFELGTYGDIAIITRGGDKFFANKFLLSARSTYFERIFAYPDCSENKSGVIDVKDVDYDVMKAMIRYLYTSQVPEMSEVADRLLIAADKYELIELKTMCERNLARRIHDKNFIKMMKLAFTYNAEVLMRAVKNYSVKRNGPENLVVDKVDGCESVSSEESLSPNVQVLALKKLTNDLGEVLRSERFSDIKIVAKDGKISKAHKHMLAARSKVFKVEIDDERKCQNSSITLDDCNSDVVTALLKYIYTCKGPITFEAAKSLLPPSQKYQLNELKEMCESKLIACINDVNFSNMAVLAHENEAHNLFAKTAEYIRCKMGSPNLRFTSQLLTLITYHEIIATEIFINASPPSKRRKEVAQDTPNTSRISS